MSLVPKSCFTKIFILTLMLFLFFLILNKTILQSIYDILDANDSINGKYDAAILECWLKPQTTMIRIADSLYRKKIVREIYITHFQKNNPSFYSGGEIPKYIDKIINLYILEVTDDTSRFQKIPIKPKDPITWNLARQVAQKLKFKNYKRIILVSESMHSKRSSLAFKKAFQHEQVEVSTIPAEFGITRQNWWKSDIGLSSVFSELIKLIYYKLFILQNLMIFINSLNCE